MELPTKLLMYIMAALVALAVGLTFWKTMMMQDFVVVDDVEVESDELEL